MSRLLTLAVLALFAAAAHAQQPAPVAAHGCKKPGEHPGRLASDNQRRNWIKDVNGYLECLKKYVSDQQAIAKPLLDQAKPHLDAANAAVDEYNKAVGEFKAEQEKNS